MECYSAISDQLRAHAQIPAMHFAPKYLKFSETRIKSSFHQEVNSCDYNLKEDFCSAVEKVAHLGEVAGPCSLAFVGRNVRLTGHQDVTTFEKATYR